MAIKRKPFFDDKQIKRLLLQIMSCFAGYQVRTGNQRDGKHRFLDVPIIYGDMSQTVGYIINGGSENVMSYVPIMSLMMVNMEQKSEWRQQPQHFEKFNFFERALTPDGKPLINEAGRKKTVERFMPVPYDIQVNLSIWSSNQDQGFQLVEQICTVFNPDIDIALSNSPADWTFLTSLIFQGSVNMEKVAPAGTEIDPLFVYTLPFDTVIWLSPAAKVYETKHIYQINTQIKELEESLDFDSFETLDGIIIRADESDIQFVEGLSGTDSEDEDDKVH